MPKLAGLNNSNASGEIAPEAWERSDLAQLQTGCEAAFNMIGLATGPAVSRGGLYHRGLPKFEAKVRRTFPWLRADGEGLVVEFGELYFRIWTARGAPIETTPGSGVPYEAPHTYSEADLAGLRLYQVGDVGYITSRDGLLFTIIKHFADNNWGFSAYDLRDGPWLAENTTAAHHLTFTALGGASWQIDADFSAFLASHVGSTLRIRPAGGGPGLNTWSPATASGGGENRISVGRVYESGGGTTGNTPPTHDQGTVSDGGVDWTFLHDGSGYLRIDAFTSTTRVTATAMVGLPLLTGETSPNFSFCAFSTPAGWPTALACVREERLVLGATRGAPDILHFSRTAGFTPDFADFKPGLGTGLVVDDDAGKVAVGERRARVVWAVDALGLIVGTTDAEYVVSGATLDDPLSPASVKPRRLSGYGSADVMPVVVQGPPILLIHAAKGGTTVRELQLAAQGDGTAGRDLSILSQHVWGLGIVTWAWSRPDNNLWVQLADGSLACLTYHFEHGVLGVRRQPLPGGWKVEDLCCSPGPDGADRLTVAAWRDKPGVGLQRAHAVLAPRADAMFLDFAETYVGAPTATVSGLDHFNGEAVGVLADGAFIDGLSVSGGTVTLPDPASSIAVGLRLLRRFKSLPFDPDRDGLPIAKVSRATECYVVLGCVEAMVRAEPQDEPDARPIPGTLVLQRRAEDTVPVVRRKRQKVALGSGADRDVRVIIETDKPFDLQVYALRPLYETPR